MDPRETRQALLRLRSGLMEQDQDLGVSLAVPLEEEAGEESSDQHTADVGTVTFARELDLSLQQNTEYLLAQVNRALEKLDEGTYGSCDRCGERIEQERLQAVPYATLCMKHQRELEREHAL